MSMQTPDFVQELMDQTRQTFEAGVHATTRVWDAAARTMSNTACLPTRFEDLRGCNERFSRNLAPVMRDNVEALTTALNTQVKTNLDFLKRSFEKAPNGGREFDWTRAAQDTLKDAMGTVRSGLEMAGETATRMVRNFSHLFEEPCTEKSDAGKATPKSAK